MLFKCKPTFLFQSVEFEWDVKSTKDLDEMFDMYDRVLKGLIRISPEQSKNQTVVSKDPLATPGQKSTMDKFGIPYGPDTTKKQAQALIQASIDGMD